jgi:hypothetical protein
MPFTLLTIPFDQDTPDLINPAGNGSLLATIPSGQYVSAYILATLQADQDCTLYLTLATSDLAAGPQLAKVLGQSLYFTPGDQLAPFVPQNTAGVVPFSAMPTPAFTTPPARLALALYPDSLPPTIIAGIVVCTYYS